MFGLFSEVFINQIEDGYASLSEMFLLVFSYSKISKCYYVLINAQNINILKYLKISHWNQLW